MKVAQQIEICVLAGTWTLKPDWPERAMHALETLGYDDVDKREGCVKAKRGTLGAGHILPCDGRRRRHTIAIDIERVIYTVETGYSLFTAADEAVFAAEARALLSDISGSTLDLTALEEAEAQRAASDHNLILGIAAAGILILGLVIYVLATA